MSQPRWLSSRTAYAIFVALALATACSRRMGLNNTDPSGQTDSRGLPFHGVANSGDGPADLASHPGLPDRDTFSKAVPFKPSVSAILPAGTLLTVRLKDALTSARPVAGKTFVAALEGPITVEDRAAIPRDAEVRGRVESARISTASRHTGYLRLTLDSIRVGDKQVPIVTSSLFARGIINRSINARGDDDDYSSATGSPSRLVAAGPRIVRLQKGRTLTFRLTAAVDLSKAEDEKALSGTR